MSRHRPSAPITELSREHQETIEDLLYRVLYPIRTWRGEKAKPSKGRRWKKLQLRKEAASKNKDEEKSSGHALTPSPAPDVLKYLTTGFNSTMRCLGGTDIYRNLTKAKGFDWSTYPKTPKREWQMLSVYPGWVSLELRNVNTLGF
ncbi:hypothetical protein MGYG_02185 [Nannizzia gypsea CBS 118893]|uniref:Uncharacterized protein n=1 Tax=Arthroderma gypseum (strain ATCC MYA-4604 / CBS 118893) TaxID=535722 RepID=E4UQ91_ARTGP|nr:hypothetical protein MGYG_02185 [Nannizzia gypsea CBS 118893]EFQ99172.1 hypothetical protein MGYG_02185 [Nannizzia gypsea CBS 118893]